MSDIIFNTLPAHNGDIGEIILNRPKALNALNFEMCTALREKLIEWQDDANIRLVLIRGEGERAFCAGGDIRMIYQNGIAKAKESHIFFQAEYEMNKIIFHFDKPYVSFLHGIVMGGGVGVSVHGSVRIAAENFIFAMPETGIGFFPDIGAGYFLTRCPHFIGTYLGLTGARINRADAHVLGLVTHCINQEHWPKVMELLTQKDRATALAELSQFTTSCGDAQLMQHKELIEECFSATTVEEILRRLAAHTSAFARETLASLAQKSPLSLKVTLEQLKRAASMNYDAINAMEYKMACRFAATPDFHEGVRAVVIDKDHKPKWQPAELADVTPQMIAEYF